MAKVKLNELANIYLGVTHTPEYVFEGVPFLSVKDISGGKICFDDCKYISKEEYDSLSEGAKPKVGDMMFCRVGTLGKPIIIPEGTPLFGTFVSLGYLRNRNSNRCDLNYLKYWMYSNSFWKQVNANVKGASQVNLNTGWLSKFDIDLPGIAEQRYRISVLDKCKSVIEKREAELAALDNLIKARFVEMFGDPIQNPKGWDMPLIEEVVANEKNALKAGPFGSALKKEYYVASGYKIYGQEQVISGDCTFGDYYIDEERYKSLENCAVQPGDVLISLVGTYGKLLIMPEVFEPGIINPRLMKITFDKEKVNPYYFKFFFQSESLKKALSQNTHGGTMDILNLGIVRKIEMPLPPLKLQNEFVDFVHQVNKSKVAVQKALDETQMLFDSLMQEYFG